MKPEAEQPKQEIGESKHAVESSGEELQAPDFELTSLDDLKGKPVVINFWAS